MGRPTIEQIEAELTEMRCKPTQTETWMDLRAKRQMVALGERGRALRDAYEAGYRAAIEVKTAGFLLLVGAMLTLHLWAS